MNDTSQDAIYESEVRRIASELFPRARTNGPVRLEGRERDGVYNEGDVIHVIEATTSNRIAKVSSDLKKSSDLVKALRRVYAETNFKIWVVTKQDPSADQQALVPAYRKQAKCPIELCSYRTFSARLVDAGSYLERRENYAFGSVRNPENDKDIRVPKSEYIPLDLLDIATKATTEPDHIVQRSPKGAVTYLLIGDFGAGKSMTLRHVFHGLKSLFLKGDATSFPIYLNLRDHFGQEDPSEALLRHGNKIGMAAPSQLVAAWRAGHAHLLLDGFDELSTTRFVRGAGGLRQSRREAMRLVRAFVEQHPKNTILFISGREHYFDSLDEMKGALGADQASVVFTLSDFTQKQVEIYLQRKGFNRVVPDWLPARPLLLGYLAVRNILGDTQDIAALAREEGWNYLIDRICERESRQIDPVAIDPKALREFVERLATVARHTNSGRGPIQLEEIRRVFQDVFAMAPDENSERLILRMPGFTTASGQEDAREFFDNDYADACRAGDVCQYVQAPHDARYASARSWSIQMGELGCAVAARRLHDASAKQLSAALLHAADNSAVYLGIDLVRIMQQLSTDYAGPRVSIRDGFFDQLDIASGPDLTSVLFQECFFSRIEVSNDATHGPRLEACEISTVCGPLNRQDLPQSIFGAGNRIDEFTNEASTNADIMDLPLSVGLRVMMTILRKLFFQAGRGRKENAFFRGLDARAQAYVPDILRLIDQLGLAKPHKIRGPAVWIPNRAFAKDAHQILQAPQQSSHQLVQRVKQL